MIKRHQYKVSCLTYICEAKHNSTTSVHKTNTQNCMKNRGWVWVITSPDCRFCKSSNDRHFRWLHRGKFPRDLLFAWVNIYFSFRTYFSDTSITSSGEDLKYSCRFTVRGEVYWVINYTKKQIRQDTLRFQIILGFFWKLSCFLCLVFRGNTITMYYYLKLLLVLILQPLSACAIVHVILIVLLIKPYNIIHCSFLIHSLLSYWQIWDVSLPIIIW